jgi:diaminopropionate ammonia-lyase
MFNKNNNLVYGQAIEEEVADLLDDRAIAGALCAFESFFDRIETPLLRMPGLAKKFGVGELYVKDESERLGLASFKAMGGAYAVFRVAQEEAERVLRQPIAFERLLDGDVKSITRQLTVCCATDGNHGRSVAMGAKLIGCRAVIYLHAGVSEARESAIRDLGAETVRVDGAYDDSVVYASQQAAERRWTVVTDTSWPGNEKIPGAVMQGYAIIAAEVARQVAPPTHIFLQAGVGGFAASVAGYYAIRYPEQRPRIIIVEPTRAACLFKSNDSRRRLSVEHGPPTIMAMLECYEPSFLAWKILSRVADFFMTVDEQDALDAMRQFASPVAGDPPVVSGESGGVGLAAIGVANQEGYRETIGLGKDSRVLVFNTEGATDPYLYETIVGRSAHQVKGGGQLHARQ